MANRTCTKPAWIWIILAPLLACNASEQGSPDATTAPGSADAGVGAGPEGGGWAPDTGSQATGGAPAAGGAPGGSVDGSPGANADGAPLPAPPNPGEDGGVPGGGGDAGASDAEGTPPSEDASQPPRDLGGPALQRFSFFVTSLAGMQRLSGSPNGFGGDLRHGEADGLAGADKICTELAERSMPGAGAKGWRAFLSAAAGPGGGAVDAIDRIGEGPWYDRHGRVVANAKADLVNPRPAGADPFVRNDFPNEEGLPNHRPSPDRPPVSNQNVLTGSNEQGRLHGATSACDRWTSTAASAGRPRVGFAWSMSTRVHWISGFDEGGCGAGVNVTNPGLPDPNHPIVGSGGGYGAIYCFALTP
jgi:hypothetical protein